MGAYEMPFKHITIVPKVNMTTKRYRFVTVDNTEQGVLATAAGPAIGVLQEPNDIGQPAQVMVSGVSFVYLEGAVVAGDTVEVGAAAGAKKASAGAVVGICLVGGADGAIGTVLLK